MPLPFLGLEALKQLVSGGKVIKLLPDLISIVTGGDPKAKALDVLGDELNEQSGRSGGKILGRAICEQVDAAMESQASGLTVDQRVELGRGLAINAALQLAEAAQEILAYPDHQAAVVRAKAAKDDGALKTAREARNAGAERVKGGLVDVGRVAAGDAPRGTI